MINITVMKRFQALEPLFFGSYLDKIFLAQILKDARYFKRCYEHT